MSTFWGFQNSFRKPKEIVVFSTKKKLKTWITSGLCRQRITYKDALRIFKYNQEETSEFIKKQTDKEEVTLDEMDHLRVEYLKKRAHQIENYIQ